MLNTRVIACLAAVLALVVAGCGSSSDSGGKGKNKNASSTTSTASAQDVKAFCSARSDLIASVQDISKLSPDPSSKSKAKSDFEGIKTDLQKMKDTGAVLASSAQASLTTAATTFLASVQQTLKSASGDPKKLLSGLQSDVSDLKSSVQDATADVSC